MEDKISQISAVNDLAGSLRIEDVKKIVAFLNPPARIFQNVRDGTGLVQALSEWGERDPDKILQCMKSIRPDLMSTVRRIHWLNVPSELTTLNPIQSLIHVLKTEIETEHWVQIGTIIPAIKNESEVESKLKILATEGIIASDLELLMKLMQAIKRDDIAQQIEQIKYSFINMPDYMFRKKFIKEIETIERNLAEWCECLRRYVTTLNRKIKQVLDDEEDVNVEAVFIPLTIVKEKPREVRLEDETTYNEIAYLRKIANKEIEIVPIDFTEELMQYEASTPEIWCLIGNPGCGKTFLCHRTALRFGSQELKGFSYCVTIPCRLEAWHEMEQSRDKAGLSINGDFIQEWLSLSMPIGPSWSKQLSKHILETDGHGLLLIIDSLDEFTKEIPFKSSLLFLLLTRKSLSQSTIILTSRPGAYTHTSASHKLSIDRFYQVLGFSPENRDKYFNSQLKEAAKRKDLESLFYLHEELKQLTLVPVNASLFASLIKGSDNLTAQTLTYLYSQLTTYLIRRQLSRMNLKELAKKRTLFQLPPNVLECLFQIGELAYLGVSTRQLTSSKDIVLKVGRMEKTCQCLGLAQEYFKTDQSGNKTRIWSFAHLTIQEFVGAVWLRMSSRGDQCLSTRYIVHSDENFAMFKMVVRFVCGLLSDNAVPVLHVIYKYLPTTPIPMEQMPKYEQFNFNLSFLLLGWTEFFRDFVSISEILFESESVSLSSIFQGLTVHLPRKLYFYLSTTSPNEWKCFLRSLRFLKSIQLIYFDTEDVTPTQFSSLLTHLGNCSLSYLVMKLEYGKEISTLFAYTQVIKENQLTSTKISLKLSYTNLDSSSDTESIFQHFSSLVISRTTLSSNSMQQVTDQLIRPDFFLLNSNPRSIHYDLLIPQLYKATQLTVLHLNNIPDEYKQDLQTLLPQLTNLQELALDGSNSYTLLPYLSSYSGIKYLSIDRGSVTINARNTFETGEKSHLIQFIEINKQSLSDLKFDRLCLREESADEFLISLHYCTNLVHIEIFSTTLEPKDITLWGRAVSRMRSLVYFIIRSVSLYDSGMASLCSGFLRHPTIRYISVTECDLSSNSCTSLLHLIPTLLLIKKLKVKREEISEPDPNPCNLLEQTAALYSVILELNYEMIKNLF